MIAGQVDDIVPADPGPFQRPANPVEGAGEGGFEVTLAGLWRDDHAGQIDLVPGDHRIGVANR